VLKDLVTKSLVSQRIKLIQKEPALAAELQVLQEWQALEKEQVELKALIKVADGALDQLVYKKYPQLSEAEIKTLLVDDKWFTALQAEVQGELERVSQTLTGRIRQLAERYEVPLSQLLEEVDTLSAKVDEHLKKMGVVWN